VAVEIDGATRMARCRCQMLPDRLKLFNRAQIPARHHRSSFKSYDLGVSGARSGLSFAKDWLENYRPGEENRGLILYGQPGRGKTHLLVAILRELIFEHGIQARFIEFSHLLAQLKAGFDEGRGPERVMGDLVDVEVLAIDELGKGRNTEFEHSVVDELISRRYNAVRTVLGTTNYPAGPSMDTRKRDRPSEPNLAQPGYMPNLVDRVGERTYSRLAEMARFAPVAGEDYRRRDGRRPRPSATSGLVQPKAPPRSPGRRRPFPKIHK